MTDSPFPYTPRWSTPQHVIESLSTLTAAVAALRAAYGDIVGVISALPVVDDYLTGDIEYPALAAQAIRAAVREIEGIHDQLCESVIELNRIATELETGKDDDVEDMRDDE
jgi:hypothetical protein